MKNYTLHTFFTLIMLLCISRHTMAQNPFPVSDNQKKNMVCIDTNQIDSSDINCLVISLLDYFNSVDRNRKPQVICGCDTVEYISYCWLKQYAGIKKFTNGPCPCKDSSLIDPSRVCDDSYNPVCGCDTVTYQNACVARYKYGIIKYTNGACPCIKPIFGKPFKQIDSSIVCNEARVNPVCGCNGITYKSRCIAEVYNDVRRYTKGICRCIEKDSIDLFYPCKYVYDPICGCDSITFFNYCVALHYNGMSPYGRVKPGPCQCSAPNLINPNEECNPEHVYKPVCGCDSVTYANKCVALYYAGVTSWTPGWCKYKCTDARLIDSTRYCSEIYDPVCGCDSITYTNECVAFYRHGITSWTSGPCATKTKDFSSNNLHYRVWPNPSAGLLHIEVLSSNALTYYVELYNTSGVLLLTKRYKNLREETLDLHGFPKGLYLLKLRHNNKQYIKKVFLRGE